MSGLKSITLRMAGCIPARECLKLCRIALSGEVIGANAFGHAVSDTCYPDWAQVMLAIQTFVYKFSYRIWIADAKWMMAGM